MNKAKKIAYIDSDKRFRKKALDVFSKGGYNCFICENGKDGLKRTLSERPDVVIVDYFLSDMNGEDFYSHFIIESQFNDIQNIPFIALTTNGKVDKSRLYRLGFSACLSKPFRSEDLFEFVEDVLISHQFKLEEVNYWETIRKSKDFLEQVVESSVDSIVTTDNKGIITYCNRACEEMLHYSFEELVGKRVSVFLKNKSTELLKICEILRNKSKVQNYKTTIVTKDKKDVSINLSICTMKNSDGRVIGALGISKVIDGKEFKEYDSCTSERLAAIVETAIAVNHEINNPLVPILGNAQFLLQDDSIIDENIRERLKAIVKNAKRIREITLKLARIKQPVTKEYLKGTRMLDIEASV